MTEYREVINFIDTPIKDSTGRGDGESTDMELETIDATNILEALVDFMPRMTCHLFPDKEEVEAWLESQREYWTEDELPETLGITDLYNANGELVHQFEICYERVPEVTHETINKDAKEAINYFTGLETDFDNPNEDDTYNKHLDSLCLLHQSYQGLTT